MSFQFVERQLDLESALQRTLEQASRLALWAEVDTHKRLRQLAVATDRGACIVARCYDYDTDEPTIDFAFATSLLGGREVIVYDAVATCRALPGLASARLYDVMLPGKLLSAGEVEGGISFEGISKRAIGRTPEQLARESLFEGEYLDRQRAVAAYAKTLLEIRGPLELRLRERWL